MKFKKIVALLFVFTLLSCDKQVCAQETAVKAKGSNAGQVLDLQNWKLTLPVNTEHNGDPDEIKQPELNTYSDDKYFFVNKNKDAVTFRANVGGETTKGSNFARSELREMVGSEKAAWSSSKGKHTLFIDQRVTHLPDVRKHMVIGQIHDDTKYVIFFRLEDTKLLVSVNGGQRVVLDPDYTLGKRFSVKFVVENNETKCFYDNVLKYTFSGSFSDAYFKAGAYVQSSCKGKKMVEGESCDAYGEVEIYDLWIKHEGM